MFSGDAAAAAGPRTALHALTTAGSESRTSLKHFSENGSEARLRRRWVS